MGELKIKPFIPDEMPKWLSTFWNRLNYKLIIAGINDDDCAVLKIGKETIVITQDFLNANPITLELGLGSFKELGRIIVASNLSDLCGSGALPVSFMVGIMLKKETAPLPWFVSSRTNSIRLDNIRSGRGRQAARPE